MPDSDARPRRSALYLPASNPRAIDKARSLPADVVIFDLEDAVAPGAKEQARENLAQAFGQGGFGGRQLVIRVNHIETPYFEADLDLAARCQPDAILVPKVSDAESLARIAGRIAARGFQRMPALWAMIETTRGLVRLGEIVAPLPAGLPRLTCLVVGTNDIARETRVSMADGRAYMLPWLMAIVLAAREQGLSVLDGVWNDFRDIAGYERELEQSRRMGFDGKTLIHPSQIEGANAAFGPSADEVAEARQIVEAFAQPEHAGAGVINLDGRMVELLHLEMAQRTLQMAGAIRRLAGG
jgi:citrate lyase subunit beta/citryl-CoA lyase